MIRLSITSQFGGPSTNLTILGEAEDEIMNVLVARLQLADFEIEIMDEEGEMVPFEEFDHG